MNIGRNDQFEVKFTEHGGGAMVSMTLLIKNIVLTPRMLDVSFRSIANPLGRQKDKVIYTFKRTRNNAL